MVTLNELMKYFNTNEMFEKYDSFFKAEMNDDNMLVLYRWDGVLDDESRFICKIDSEFNISIDVKDNGYWMPFNHGDLFLEDWEDANNPTVKELANSIIESVIMYELDRFSLSYDNILYLHNLLNEEEYHITSQIDIYNRLWTIKDNLLTVEDDE